MEEHCTVAYRRGRSGVDKQLMEDEREILWRRSKWGDNRGTKTDERDRSPDQHHIFLNCRLRAVEAAVPHGKLSISFDGGRITGQAVMAGRTGTPILGRPTGGGTRGRLLALTRAPRFVLSIFPQQRHLLSQRLLFGLGAVMYVIFTAFH